MNTRLFMALVASLILYSFDTRLDAFVTAKSYLATAVYPLQLIAALPNDLYTWSGEYFETRTKLKQHNEKLKVNQLMNSVRLQRLESLERENMRLHELLGSSFRLSERVMVANLVTVDPDPYSQQVIINRGAKNGVFVGQSVLDAKGIMGQVIAVNQYSSRVLLLTDPSHAIPVEVNRNGVRSVVIGRGSGMPLQLMYQPHNVDIRVGDLIVSSGLGGRFPSGYPVGVVSHINNAPNKPFAQITVEAAARLATSREVLLVLADSINNAEHQSKDNAQNMEPLQEENDGESR